MTLSDANGQRSAKKPPKIPEIIEYLYKNYSVDKSRHANCTICNEFVSDVLTTTYNFVRHMRLSHPDRVDDYFEFKNSRKKMKANELSHDFKPVLNQENVDFIIVKYLIVDCGLPYRYSKCYKLIIYFFIYFSFLLKISRNTWLYSLYGINLQKMEVVW
jgi:hypothetical protein